MTTATRDTETLKLIIDLVGFMVIEDQANKELARDLLLAIRDVWARHRPVEEDQ